MKKTKILKQLYLKVIHRVKTRNNDDDGSGFKKPKLTNKERARNARQRKKKYYEDLEKRAEYLEKRVVQLNNELDSLRRQIR